MGASKNRFLVEIVGLPALRASKVSGLDLIKHTPNKTNVGNQGSPILGLGVHEVGEVTVTHAEGLDGATTAGTSVFQWVRNFVKGIDTTKRGARVIQLDDDFITPIAEYELRNCVPNSYKADDSDGSSGDASMFSFSFTPEDSQRY